MVLLIFRNSTELEVSSGKISEISIPNFIWAHVYLNLKTTTPTYLF